MCKNKNPLLLILTISIITIIYGVKIQNRNIIAPKTPVVTDILFVANSSLNINGNEFIVVKSSDGNISGLINTDEYSKVTEYIFKSVFDEPDKLFNKVMYDNYTIELMGKNLINIYDKDNTDIVIAQYYIELE